MNNGNNNSNNNIGLGLGLGLSGARVSPLLPPGSTIGAPSSALPTSTSADGGRGGTPNPVTSAVHPSHPHALPGIGVKAAAANVST